VKQMTEFDHPVREGAILRLVSDNEPVEPLLVVHQRHRDLDDGHIEYELCDPTLTGYYQYYADDVDILFEDTGLTNEEPKPIMDDEIRELYRRLHDHTWHEAVDSESGETKQYCIHCRMSRGEVMAENFGGDPEDYDSGDPPAPATERTNQILDSFIEGDSNV